MATTSIVPRARAVIVVSAFIASLACGGSPSPVAPTSIPACQTNRTGTATFRNDGGRTVDILWNNARLVTLSPGQLSQEFTMVAGGAQYVMEVIITNTNIRACNLLVATPLQCQNNPYATCVGF
jgi:hypothetical protein